MQKCSFCGADLQANSRFCGKCGSMQDVISTDTAATMSNSPQPQSWAAEGGTLPATWPPSSNDPAQDNTPTWSPNGQVPETPPPLAAENEDEQRRGIPPWSPVYGAALGADALLGSGQASPTTPGAPVVQGTPQIGSVPSVAGSPTLSTNAPAGNPAQGAANAPITHPVQGFGNAAPVTQPVQGPGNVPISHPVQVPVNSPITLPVQVPQPIHPPTQPPGTHGHDPIHKHHKHHTHHVAKVTSGSTVKAIILVVTAVVVIAAGGIAVAAHFLSHSQPLISITSNFKVGNAPAGADGTILHISGQQFPSNSAITILLDGHVAPGNPGTRSDSNGTFRTNVTITNAWSVGTHTLTARDSNNNSTHNSVSVTIVQPGQANTPGPNGAPPDDASFKLNITVQATNTDIADPFAINPVLIITGHPDPEGGTVCSPDDNGQSFTRNSTGYNGTPYTQLTTATCSGKYKAGQISYIETDTSAKGSFQSNGVNVNCVLNNPTVDSRLTGAYAGNDTFSGTYNAPYIPYTCDQQGYTFSQVALQGTWTATIVKQ